MAETVTRSRLEETGERDRYNKPIYQAVKQDFTAHAFAPVVVDDVKGIDAVTASDGGTIYFRNPNMVDALPDDIWTVRGIDYKSEGREATWFDIDALPIGTVVVVKRTTFTTD